MQRHIRVFIGALLLSNALVSGAQIGNTAPDFTATDTHGETHTLYDYLDAGKTVVLDFFYTTCIPCQFYTPQVNLAYEKYGCNTANVIFMSIDYDDTDAEVLAYDAEYDIHYPSISGIQGGGNAIVNQYGIIGFPTFYVIDSTRKIVEVIDPPTLQVFDYRFEQLGIDPAECEVSTVGNIAQDQRMMVFPNPVVESRLFVRAPGDNAETAKYRIIDVTGRSVQKGMIDFGVSHLAVIDIENVPAGILLFQIITPSSALVYASVFLKL